MIQHRMQNQNTPGIEITYPLGELTLPDSRKQLIHKLVCCMVSLRQKPLDLFCIERHLLSISLFFATSSRDLCLPNLSPNFQPP